jgi:hypothetical protein
VEAVNPELAMAEHDVTLLYKEKKNNFYFRSWIGRENLERLAEGLGFSCDDLIELVFMRGLFDCIHALEDMPESEVVSDIRLRMLTNTFLVHLRNAYFLYQKERNWQAVPHGGDPSNTEPIY